MLVARRKSFPPGTRIASHKHVRGQFLFAASRTMSVRTPGRAWLVPPSRALWIPADTEHTIDVHGELRMCTLYLDAASSRSLPPDCAVLEVTALLRELIMRNPTLNDGEPTGRSARTLYRQFHAETGLSFIQWRKQACLLHAVRLLGAAPDAGPADTHHKAGNPVRHTGNDYETRPENTEKYKRKTRMS